MDHAEEADLNAEVSCIASQSNRGLSAHITVAAPIEANASATATPPVHFGRPGFSGKLRGRLLQLSRPQPSAWQST
jgi:hypothetical protein